MYDLKGQMNQIFNILSFAILNQTLKEPIIK